jgi:hypothetical protein
MYPNASNAALPAARTNFQLPNQADQHPQITERPPTDSDGVNVALSQNALWRWNQWVFQAQTNTSGDPEWVLLNPYGSPLPGDAASVAPAGLWGLKQLKANYSGNLFIAQGADGTQVTVGQLSDGSPDLRTMLATLANDLPIRVAEVFDQSGNGYHLTQSTAVNQPLLLIDTNGEPFVVFDSWTVSGSTVTARTSFLTIPNTLSVTKCPSSEYLRQRAS